MRRFVTIVLVVCCVLFLLPAPFALAKPASPPGPPPEESYSLIITASGSWHQNPGFQCPPNCDANSRFTGNGTLTYYNDTFSSSVPITINGTSHANWAGVVRSNPCTPINGSIDVVTAGHSKIHMKMSGTTCMVFSHYRWTGQNELWATFTITSGVGLFSEASGSGTISASTYPRSNVWSAGAAGTMTCVPKSAGYGILLQPQD